jgi:hypothetical protein
MFVYIRDNAKAKPAGNAEGSYTKTKRVGCSIPTMGEALFPVPTPIASTQHRYSYLHHRGFICFSLAVLVALQLFYSSQAPALVHTSSVPINAEGTLARCRALDLVPGPSPDFYKRTKSDRDVPGTRATLILGARIWTGGHNGTEVVEGHVYFDNGIIKGVGGLDVKTIKRLRAQRDLDIVHAEGAWVTPG